MSFLPILISGRLEKFDYILILDFPSHL
jgi:hypothetical protein